MTDGVQRLPVVPRDVATAMTVAAVSLASRATAAAVVVVTAFGIIDLYIHHGLAADLPAPLVSLAALLAVVLLAALRPSAPALVAFILAGGLAMSLFLVSVVGLHPGLLPDALILINRPTTVLVLIGGQNARPLSTIAWGAGWFVMATAARTLVSLGLGVPVLLAPDSTILLVTYAAIYLVMAIIVRSPRGSIPDLLRFRQETRNQEDKRRVERRAATLLHDTVLNDLSLVMNGPELLDDRMRARMRLDVQTLAGTELFDEPTRAEFVDQSDIDLRNQLMAMVSDFQWRGLSVEVTGDTGQVARMTPQTVSAAVGALRACLENVLRHSGTAKAELIVAVSDTAVSWTISDGGKGFDLKAIESDRMGLRLSVVGRVEAAGGAVRIWSAPGRGTSVLITLPRQGTDAAEEAPRAEQ